jgi:SAM-dependent methyltransferase
MEIIDKEYWTNRYKNNQVGWDLGSVSTPLKIYIDQLTDPSQSILIPGAGNSYEAEYLFNAGFTNTFLLDISPVPLQNFKNRMSQVPESHLICQNFFDHQGQYDLILEQTFFCALDPLLRKSYVEKAHGLLKPGGRIVGLLFNIPLNTDHPPFGGNKEEYSELFTDLFEIKTMESCYNSITPRAGNELFINVKAKK